MQGLAACQAECKLGPSAQIWIGVIGGGRKRKSRELNDYSSPCLVRWLALGGHMAGGMRAATRWMVDRIDDMRTAMRCRTVSSSFFFHSEVSIRPLCLRMSPTDH